MMARSGSSKGSGSGRGLRHAAQALVLLCVLVAPPGCQRSRPSPPTIDLQARATQPALNHGGTKVPTNHVLDNGLTVVLQETHRAPVVALQLWVGVGSADELEQERGLAHLHEHMLFKGTTRRGLGEISMAVEAAGGDINAWTSYDQTVYHLVLASRFFDEGLEILADALFSSTFDEEALAAELEVVLDEIRRSRDMPARLVGEQLFQLAYQQHPYRQPIIGTLASVQAHTRQKLLDFNRRWYVPGNMTLVIVGDVQASAVLPRVAQLFGSAPARERPRALRAPEPPQQELRVGVHLDDIAEAHLHLAFHIPGLRHDATPALDLLGVLLGQSEAARLVQEVKRRQAAATEVFAYAYTPAEPGLFVVGAATPSSRAERATAAILTELFRLHHELVTDEELERARRILSMDLVYQKETVEGLARKLGFHQLVAQDPEFETHYHARLARVTPAELRQVARTYFQAHNLTLALLLPSGSPTAPVAPEADQAPLASPPGPTAPVAAPAPPPELVRRAAPATAAASPPLDRARLVELVRTTEQQVARRYRPFPLPPPQHGIRRVVLDNGLVLLIQEDHTLPLVAVRGLFLGGLKTETEATQGLEHLLSRLLTRGTSLRSGEELARRFDALGGTISGFAGRNSLGLRAEFHSAHLTEALALLAECVLDPAFPQAEVERERELVLEEIRARDDNLGNLAFRAFAQLLFGDHPYRFDLLGEEETVARLERGQLRDAWRQRYVPSRLVLTVVGDVDPAAVVAQVNQQLGGPQTATMDPPAPRAWRRPEARQVVFRYRERAQAHLVLGFPGTTVNHPDRFPLELLSTILAGSGGRLFVELRDRRGLAYSLGAMSVEGVDPGSFSVYLATAPERLDEAFHALLEELRRLLAEGVTAAELQRAQEYLIGSQAIGLQRSSERTATLGYNELYQLGLDAHLRYPAQIQAITREQLDEVARRYLDLDRYTLAVVKPDDTQSRALPLAPAPTGGAAR